MPGKVDDPFNPVFTYQPVEQGQPAGVWRNTRTGNLQVTAGQRQKRVFFLLVHQQIQSLYARTILDTHNSPSAFLDYAKNFLGTLSDGAAGEKDPRGIRLER